MILNFVKITFLLPFLIDLVCFWSFNNTSTGITGTGYRFKFPCIFSVVIFHLLPSRSVFAFRMRIRIQGGKWMGNHADANRQPWRNLKYFWMSRRVVRLSSSSSSRASSSQSVISVKLSSSRYNDMILGHISTGSHLYTIAMFWIPGMCPSFFKFVLVGMVDLNLIPHFSVHFLHWFSCTSEDPVFISLNYTIPGLQHIKLHTFRGYSI